MSHKTIKNNPPLFFIFRINLGDDFSQQDNNNLSGLGHAHRCIRIIDELEKKHSLDIRYAVVVNNNHLALDFFKRRNIFAIPISDASTAISSADVIISDINNYDISELRKLNQHAKIINLAPRGKTKYQADYTIVPYCYDDFDSKISYSDLIASKKIIIDSNFAIINKDLVTTPCDSSNDNIKKKFLSNKVVVFMGGCDKLNLTQQVVQQLTNVDFEDDFEASVILGEFYPHKESLFRIIAQGRNPRLTISVFESAQSNKYPALLSQARMAIMAMGLSFFDAVYCKTPTVNIGQSTFHDHLGRFFSNNGLTTYIRFDNIPQPPSFWQKHFRTNDQEYDLYVKQVSQFAGMVNKDAAGRIVDLLLEIISNKSC